MTNTEEIGPNRISFPTFLLKIVAGLAGGGVGSLILMGIFFLTSSVLSPITGDNSGYVSPIFIFILTMMVFLSSTVSNIVATWLLALTEREKYQRNASALYQIFILSLIILLLMVPVYFLTATQSVEIIPYAVGLHIIIAAQLSAIILEVVSNYRHALVGVYGITFSILISAGAMLGLSNLIDSAPILLFIALPIVWVSIALAGSLTTIIYGFIARTYDKDFLSTQTLYGADYGKEVEEVQTDEPQKAHDEAGADFLRHN